MYQIANYNLFSCFYTYKYLIIKYLWVFPINISCFYTYKYLIIKYLWVFPINNRDFPTSL